jgi:transcriptional regulator with XRE-family HTH domain
VSLSDDVAREMRALRKRRKMSAEQLAQRMSDLGMPWSRTVVAKLETGRRGMVTVDELFALADALEVQVGALLPDMRSRDMRHDALSEAIAALERLRDGK